MAPSVSTWLASTRGRPFPPSSTSTLPLLESSGAKPMLSSVFDTCAVTLEVKPVGLGMEVSSLSCSVI